MKTFLKLVLLLLFTTIANAQTKTKLPFTGTRYFNFSGGSCCQESITINKDGSCVIKGYQAPEWGNDVTIHYRGKFQNIIWVYEKGKKSYGYKIEGKYITSLNKNGKPESGCKEDNVICKEELLK